MAFPRSTISSTLLLGLAKALSWYFTTRAVRHTAWCVAAAIGTFSIMATDDPFTQSSGSGAALRVVACFFALGQTVHMMPKQATARWALWILILFPLVPYLANMFAIRAAQSSIPMSFRHATDHPVETLAHGAEASFENLLQRQSQSYAVAHDEYRRRYQMEPPPGFEAWYEFAVSHQSPIIDDFDTMYNAISPFWAISGKEVIEIMGDAQDASGSELSRAFQSRLVFDMDGNGISGRYYKLLASKSVPLKQTILREWHDDRLMPWVHYIPVSLSMEELPELVTYLLSTETGQQRAKKVADQGRDWFARAMRQDDLSIYSYRLLIELARLQDPERPGRR
ncbi:hypothetical protein G6O67_006990 [Ophiocordyceps sinensis]|uniref:Glycosyl transferase CAP10 domain-containing protein n=1 Tax=Ophiocordyceps sinensis TaxID=72228 RepID=A0A8H4LTQ4_9HYPO|nr:hypothetical protein G6O67_006990 [Ophiocordyceps sinensis]